MTARTGIFADIPADVYHADRLGDQPSLSRSGIVTLLNGTPAEFAAANPRLTQWPDEAERKGTDATDLGEVIHLLVLGDGCKLAVRNPWDFTSKKGEPYSTWSGEAKAWRDEQRAAGMIVIGSELHATAEMIAARLLAVLRSRFPDWDEGQSEQTGVWERRLNDGASILCRARIDRLLPSAIVDVKTTALSVSDAELGKMIALKGLDVQHAFYQDGVEAITGKHLPFVFAFIRTVPPYTVRLVQLDGEPFTVAQEDGTERVIRPGWPLNLTRERIDKAAHIFGRCVERGTWPDEPVDCAPEPPEWLASRWMMDSLTDEER